MARSRTARSQPRPKVDSVMADWERELLGLSAASKRISERGSRIDRMSDLVAGRSSRGSVLKGAQAAELQRSRAEAHKRGRLTAAGKPRRSRRSLKRELHGH